MILKATEPFHFFTLLSLTVMTGIKARDLQELLGYLRTVPESVIYHHTHRFLQAHQYLVPEPPNDFAYWVTHMIQDEKLGERRNGLALKQLLSEPGYAKKLGDNGKEHVRQNFLLTRHLRDYPLLFLFLQNGQPDFIHLTP